jgi:hypothetical protein
MLLRSARRLARVQGVSVQYARNRFPAGTTEEPWRRVRTETQKSFLWWLAEGSAAVVCGPRIMSFIHGEGEGWTCTLRRVVGCRR